ncbi:MAG TPA: hypothetical protein VFM37_10865 [Pseudonocardiaceae bacterium]|nr:hypothetical protein [Pseudonocardiaceae bacterium]
MSGHLACDRLLEPDPGTGGLELFVLAVEPVSRPQGGRPPAVVPDGRALLRRETDEVTDDLNRKPVGVAGPEIRVILFRELVDQVGGALGDEGLGGIHSFRRETGRRRRAQAPVLRAVLRDEEGNRRVTLREFGANGRAERGARAAGRWPARRFSPARSTLRTSARRVTTHASSAGEKKIRIARRASA